MIVARPTAAQERWLLLAGRYPLLRAAAENAGNGGGWKTTTWLARCLGFVLGLIGAGMFAGILAPFHSPWLIGGLLLMVVAEWLVAQRRVFRSGVEEALYLCGALAVVAQILIWNSSGHHEDIGVALLATAVLLVGWRLLNPIFTTLAAAGFSLAIAAGGGHLFDSGRMHEVAAGIFCAALAVIALVLGGRMWRRPAHDHILDGLVMLMPWLSYVWLQGHFWYIDPLLRRALPALAVACAFFVVNCVVGVRRRQHAPLIGALGGLACICHGLALVVHWPLHWKMIVSGAVLLAAAVLLDRRLRHARDGITSQAQVEPAGLDLVQLAAAAHLTPVPATHAEAAVHGQGGSFGGGGASGRF
ncbi:MAG TPA: hypothetical protein VN645_06075 [Steroidobacteraceae bacterium]|nr:hypothetical protein [Steroidobacteraceae bacterium]